MLADKRLLVHAQLEGLDARQSHHLPLLGDRLYLDSEVLELLQHLLEERFLDLQQIAIRHGSVRFCAHAILQKICFAENRAFD